MPHRGGHVKDDDLSDCARKGIAGKHQGDHTAVSSFRYVLSLC